MERKYKAFISYRHLPLQMEVAKAVHRRIEHYVIPKNLRKDGARKVGLVFRDQDELPIAGSLSANIQTALDNSEYLIVICTPETSGSEWVLREISYFLEHHDHDHVLAVLADGEPEEAFPKQITEIRGEDGEVVEIVEPLAANIAAPTRAKRRKLFQTESLRILAALIGCPYDALYRREQRYRFRRLAIASGAVFALAAAFVGLLLNRNAKIREQLRASQINESRALAAHSYSSFQNGNYREALSSALEALPSEDNDRPYVADAEFTLVRELSLYGKDCLHADQSIEQPTAVSKMQISRDTKFLATLDAYDTVRVFDTYSGKLLWEKQRERDTGFEYIDEQQAVFAGGELLDAATGERIWYLESAHNTSFSRNGKYAAFSVYENSKEHVYIMDAGTGEILHSCMLEGNLFTMTGLAVSDDGRFAAVASASSSQPYGVLQLYDAENDRLLTVDDQMYYSMTVLRKLVFMDNGDLLSVFAGTAADNGGAAVYDREKDWGRRFDTALRLDQSSIYMNGKLIIGGSIDLLDFSDDMIIFGSLKNLYLIDRETGEISMDLLLPDVISAGILNKKNNSYGLILENGLITGGLVSGILTSDVSMYYTDLDHSLSKGAIGGRSYRESVFAAVNDGYKTVITILRWQENDDMVPVAPEETEMDLKETRIYASSSGKLMAAVEYDYSNKVLSCMLWHEADQEPQFCTIQCEKSFLFDPGEIFLTEDGKLIAEDYVCDLAAGTVSGLTPSGKTPDELGMYSLQHGACSAYRRSDNSVLSASLIHEDVKELPLISIWKNTDCLKTFSLLEDLYSRELRYSFCAAGSCGWAVLTTADREGEHPEMASVGYAYDMQEERFVTLTHLDREYASVCALGEESPLMAAVGDKGSILLVNIPDDRVMRTIETGIPSAALKKLLFVKNDTLLFVMAASGDLLIYDVQTGEQLNRAYFGDINFNFHDGACFTPVFSSDGRQLLLIVNDDTYTEPAAFCLETENWNCVGMHVSAAHYLPDSNRLIVKPVNDTVYYAPFYSREDIMEKAREILAREPADMLY